MKEGYRTTEFWLTLLTTIISAAVGLGLLPELEGEQLQSGLTAVITGIFMIVPVAVYIWNRATVKKATVEAMSNSTPEQVAEIESVMG
jgi:hypothetical protein